MIRKSYPGYVVIFEQFRSKMENMQRLLKFFITFQDFSRPSQVYMMVSSDGVEFWIIKIFRELPAKPQNFSFQNSACIFVIRKSNPE